MWYLESSYQQLLLVQLPPHLEMMPITACSETLRKKLAHRVKGHDEAAVGSSAFKSTSFSATISGHCAFSAAAEV